ncbi:MAG: hypothetical protein RMK01_02395 [Thermomicrobium sp.]|nr:hypothetical protein [Thermomicrobium sp.]
MLRGDLEHPKLPTSSLLSALDYPPLRQWSDRGGASRALGEAWASFVRGYLERAGAGPVDWSGRGGTLVAVTSLDVDRERWGRIPRRVRVPDFLALIDEADRLVVLALDAKFDPSVADEEQISAWNLRRLVEALEALRVWVQDRSGRRPQVYVDGAIVSPDHWSTRELVQRSGRASGRFTGNVVRVPVDPRVLFRRLPLARLVGRLARIDALPIGPADDLAVATYYFRLVCTCRWCWEEARVPLLGPADDRLPLEELTGAIEARRCGVDSAFHLVEPWVSEIEPIRQLREAVKPFLDPPISAAEVEEAVQSIGADVAKARVWRVLRERYRARLVERFGVITVEDAELSSGALLLRLASEQAALVGWAREEIGRIVRELAGVEAEEGWRDASGELRGG